MNVKKHDAGRAGLKRIAVSALVFALICAAHYAVSLGGLTIALVFTISVRNAALTTAACAVYTALYLISASLLAYKLNNPAGAAYFAAAAALSAAARFAGVEQMSFLAYSAMPVYYLLGGWRGALVITAAYAALTALAIFRLYKKRVRKKQKDGIDPSSV